VCHVSWDCVLALCLRLNPARKVSDFAAAFLVEFVVCGASIHAILGSDFGIAD